MRRRGFTLLEGMVTLLLVFILLGAIGQMMTMYSTIARRSSNKDISLYAGQVALDSIRFEVRQAIDISIPDPQTLVLKRVDPWNPLRLEDPAPSPPPANWSPHRNADLIEVRFELLTATDPADYQFRKTVTYPSGSFEEIVCTGLNGVHYEMVSRLLSVEVTVLDPNMQAVTTGVEVLTHLPEEVYP